MTLERLTGSAERPLDAPLLKFDIPALLTQVKQESTWRTGSRNAITLLKTQGLRVVLVAMHAGTVIPSHQAEGPMTVQLLEGQMVFSAGSKSVTLAPAQVLTLQPGIPHDLEAKGECAFLLTIATETPHPVE